MNPGRWSMLAVCMVVCVALASCSDPIDVNANRRIHGDSTDAGQWGVTVDRDTLDLRCRWPDEALIGSVALQNTSTTQTRRISSIDLEPTLAGFRVTPAPPFVLAPGESVDLAIAITATASYTGPLPLFLLAVRGEPGEASVGPASLLVRLHARNPPIDTTVASEALFFRPDSVLADSIDTVFQAVRSGALSTHDCFPITIEKASVSGSDAAAFALVGTGAPLPANVPESSRFGYVVRMQTARRGALQAVLVMNIVTTLGNRTVRIPLSATVP